MKSFRYCGRIFTENEIEQICDLIASNQQLSRRKLSCLICNQLGWLRRDGRPKDMSCRVALIRMDRDGLITLPPLRYKYNSKSIKTRPAFTSASDPCFPLVMPVKDLGELKLCHVKTKKDSSLWNELIERYHYLKYKTLPGEQIRYLIYNKSHLLAALGFGAAAWTVAPRDKFIGWTKEQREKNLYLVVNNARFLILPWITSRNLASKILAMAAKQLPSDWLNLYGCSPALLETFVEKQRFKGTCYKAANWIHVGQTKGRGKLDRYNRYLLPVKDILLYPLNKNFRQILCS